MKWKLLLAIMIIAVIGVLVLISGIAGTQFRDAVTGNVVAEFFTGMFANPSGKSFVITLTTTRETFYGKKYSMTDVSLTAKGSYKLIKIGDDTVSLTDAAAAEIAINKMDGSIEFKDDGSIAIIAKTNSITVDSYVTTSDKVKDVSIVMMPSRYAISNIRLSKIVFDSVIGNLKTMGETGTDKESEVSLKGGKMEISNFAGSLTMTEVGEVIMIGSVSSVKGDKFSFSV